MSYDTKCWDLACQFIDCADGVDKKAPAVIAKATDELAQAIQTTIEDFIRDFERKGGDR